MSAARIIPSIKSAVPAATKAFYCGLIGLEVGMEEGSFMMLGSKTNPSAQLIINDNGHPGLPPGFAIDVETPERVQEIHDAVTKAGFTIVEPLADKPWGIRRFSMLDPNGVCVTIAAHL